MRLTLLTFGDRLAYHYQASFAILTYLRSDAIHAVTVLTDRPEYYRYFGERVECLAVDAGQLAAWRGEHDFFWRIKMQGIAEVVRRHPGEDILYVDSDTFVAGDLSRIAASLQAGQACMHELEGLLARLTTKTERNTWRSLAGRQLGPLRVTGQSPMWNAGVVGLPAAGAEAMLSLAIDVCDAICATPSPRRLAEQLAFSLALDHVTTLCAASPEIAHYWGNKPGWEPRIAEFFLYSRLAGSSLDEDLARVAQLDLTSIPILLKQRNARRRLTRLLESLIQPKMTRYAGQPASSLVGKGRPAGRPGVSRDHEGGNHRG